MSKLKSPCHVGHPKYMYSVLGLFGHPVYQIVDKLEPEPAKTCSDPYFVNLIRLFPARLNLAN